MFYVVTLKQNKSRDPENHNKWFIICTEQHERGTFYYSLTSTLQE